MNNDNNKPISDNDNIDDILDILQKRKNQDMMNGNADNAATRLDNAPVKPSVPTATGFSFSAQGFNSTPQPLSNSGVSGAHTTVNDASHNVNSPAVGTPTPAAAVHPSAAASQQHPVSSPIPNGNDIQNAPAIEQPAANHSPLPPITATPVAPAASSGTPSAMAKPVSKEQRSDMTKEVPVKAITEKPVFKDTKAPSASSAQGISATNPAKQNVSTNVPSGTSHAVSLSDFDTKSTSKDTKKAKQGKNRKKHYAPGWLKVILYLVIVVGVSVFLSITAIKVGNDIFAFVKPDDEIAVEIPEEATLKEVAQILHESGVIAYPWVFEIYSKDELRDSSYLTEEFTPGTHIVTPMMNYDKLLEALCVSSYDKSVVTITIPEGYDFMEIMDLFVENGVMKEKDKDEYIKQLQEFPYEYTFITKLEEQGSFENEDRAYRLEGYLFPDTYQFYKNENPVAAIDKLLSNFDKKFTEEMYEKADELGLTVDEVIILASMIEAEGDSPENFAKISSVFHNRLNDKSGRFKLLGSDVTTLYAYKLEGDDKKALGENDTDLVHPYNTYTSIGLPPGPICNPGIEAIYAALYPDDTNYYYFLTMSNGETVFAQTQSQHDANIEKSNRLAAQSAQ